MDRPRSGKSAQVFSIEWDRMPEKSQPPGVSRRDALSTTAAAVSAAAAAERDIGASARQIPARAVVSHLSTIL
jgi:hypothetical protein